MTELANCLEAIQVWMFKTHAKKLMPVRHVTLESWKPQTKVASFIGTSYFLGQKKNVKNKKVTSCIYLF